MNSIRIYVFLTIRPIISPFCFAVVWREKKKRFHLLFLLWAWYVAYSLTYLYSSQQPSEKAFATLFAEEKLYNDNWNYGKILRSS